MTSLKFNVFGHRVLVEQSNQGWQIYYIGDEGKRRLATDIRLDPNTPESDIRKSLDDLCHEWATPRYPNVERLD